MNKITIDTSTYSEREGRKPRASDYGKWVFNLGRSLGRTGSEWTECEYTGKYADAKKYALAEARSLSCDKIAVDP